MSNEDKQDLHVISELLDTMRVSSDKNLAAELNGVLDNMTNGEIFLLKVGDILSNQERNSAKLDEISQSLKDLEKSMSESREITDKRILDQYEITQTKHEEFKNWVSNSIWRIISFAGGCYVLWLFLS